MEKKLKNIQYLQHTIGLLDTSIQISVCGLGKSPTVNSFLHPFHILLVYTKRFYQQSEFDAI